MPMITWGINMEQLQVREKEISKRYSLNKRFSKIKEKVTNIQFKNNLEGVYGYVDNKIFEKHKKALLGLREKE